MKRAPSDLSQVNRPQRHSQKGNIPPLESKHSWLPNRRAADCDFACTLPALVLRRLHLTFAETSPAAPRFGRSGQHHLDLDREEVTG